MRYEKRDRVVIKVYDKHVVGEITDKRKVKKGNIFEVTLESGKEIECSRSATLTSFKINDTLTKMLWDKENKEYGSEESTQDAE